MQNSSYVTKIRRAFSCWEKAIINFPTYTCMSLFSFNHYWWGVTGYLSRCGQSSFFSEIWCFGILNAAIFYRFLLDSYRCNFLSMFKKKDTSCKQCVLAMFLVNVWECGHIFCMIFFGKYFVCSSLVDFRKNTHLIEVNNVHWTC